MANFYMTLSAEEIAQQVATLLNAHNQLKSRYNAHTVMSIRGAYFVDIIGGQVVGCSAILRESAEVTRQFHLCVHPDFRRRGIGRKLKLAGLRNVSTPYVYVTIREDNVASINLNMSTGFSFVKKDWAHDHYVLTFGRMMTDGRPKPNSMDFEERGQITAHHGNTRPLFLTPNQFVK